jgi:hypothetical protein
MALLGGQLGAGPSGPSGPEEVAEATTLRYTLNGERMTVIGPLLDARLDCVRRCFDEAFVRDMDARDGTTTGLSVACDAAKAP